MGMIADLDGPQFMAERSGPRVLEMSINSVRTQAAPEVQSRKVRPCTSKPVPVKPRVARCIPGAVCALRCQPIRADALMFAWQAPHGGAPVDGYRIERTRDGHAYEKIAQTANKSFVLSPVPFDDGYFYRVSAFNERGAGSVKWVVFYLRRHRDSILQHVPVRAGLRVNISEFIRP